MFLVTTLLFIRLTIHEICLESKVTIVEAIIIIISVTASIAIAVVGSFIGCSGLLVVVQLDEIDLPSQYGTDATETLDELCALTRPICDKFQIATVLLVVFGHPFHEALLFYNLELDAGLLVMEEVLIGLLLLVEVDNRLLAGAGIAQDEAADLEVLPYNQILGSTQFQGLEGIVDHEAVLARVLTDLVHEGLEQLLLLHQLDGAEGVGTELDGLVEPILATVGHIDHLDDDLGKPTVEQVGTHQLGLEVGRTRQDDALNVGLLPIGNKQLGGQLGNLADVVVSLLETKTGETQGGLTTTAVLLGQVDGEFVQDFTVGSLDGTIQATITVHHDEPKGLVVNEKLVKVLGMELVVTQIQRGVDRLEGLEINVDALLLALVGNDRAAVDDQPVLGTLVVQLETLLRRSDGTQHRQTVHARLDVGRSAVPGNL